MESIRSSFLTPSFVASPNPSLKSLEMSKPYKFTVIRAAARSPNSWTLSDGNAEGGRWKVRRPPPNFHPRKPLSDDDARRIIHAKARYLRQLRRNQGCHAETPRWIRRTPEQMARLVEDARLEGEAHGRLVLAAVRSVRALAGRPEGSYNMREVMAAFVAKLSFREMCVVLKEQRGWRQARDFFAWMKLQLCYRPSVIVYTILLKTYGQVGKIRLAEQIFLEMLEAGCEPDEVACGTMLCAYARWGRHKSMMTFYSAMRRREILPSIKVYNLMMSSFQKQKFHENVIYLWEQIWEAGLVPDGFTYTIVIYSFVKQDLLEDAFDAFSKMKKAGFIPEESTYSLLINLSVKDGREDQALQIYEEMKPQGIVPSNYTCASVLTLHYRNEDYSKALSLFSEMERNKIFLDEVIYGLLIRIYGKLGLHEDAERTFQDIKRLGLLTNEKTYVAMAQVHLNAGEYDKALDVLDLMRLANVELSKFGYSAFLRCYIAKEDLESAESTFKIICKIAAFDAVCCNELLIMYLKLGLLEKARALVTQIRRYEVPFDENLYRTVLEVYCREGIVIDAEQLLDQMLISGLSLDKINKVSLISLYGKAGELQKAEELLKMLEQPDTASLAWLFPSGNVVKAKWVYEQSVKLGSQPEDTATAAMINFYGRSQQLQEALEIYCSVSGSHQIGSTVYTSMIDAYCRCGKVNDADLLYREMSEKGHSVGMFQKAESIIHDSLSGEVELDTVAYNSVYGQGGKLMKAIEMFNAAANLGLSIDEKAYTNMISCYGKAGRIDEASKLFSKMKEEGIKPGKISYNTIINAYATVGLHRQAENLFKDMEGEGHSPDSLTYLALIRANTESQRYSEAEKFIFRMQEAEISPSCAHFNRLIFAFVREGRIGDAERVCNLMKRTGLHPDLACRRSMIRGYMEYGMVTEGLIFYETTNCLVKPDGFISSAAVHLYDYAGRQAEAGKILDLMNCERLLFLRNLKVGSKLKDGKSVDI
ncbi:Pentatricopeptide repeat-containing protein [Apostasia shenzhenica]|uniref:Pentatricopeptide repeat-containing protein n=1 Tax=Apostasia shenzhenica TaxID=1088818 RepID=A0A2I0BEI8_9ASPA|nr:Pentatricopeptide repeat-containing protein [Apostasia shenzhenica]